ncbi:MAG: hypothetical protein IPG60_09185 [Bacteroidetes bacterium]|nr:hypothetical protein [Bacteroidota bacterium]MBK7108628.1 hypothetical protein [Bacteroidota bacterium]MBK8489048.1 hypothetical protein [Bacteroidota bacterium]MBK8680897.1 hypothetical protein [Bacteroidota bacterium]
MLNNQQVKKGNLIIVVMLIMVLVMLLPVAIGALISGVWFLGLPLMVSCILIGWGIYKKFKEHSKAEIIIPEKKDNTHPHSPDQEKNSDILILGEWIIDAESWKQFIITEKKLRNEDSIYLFIGAIVMGTMGLMAARDVNLITAILFASAIGLIVVWLRRYFAIKNLKMQMLTPRQIVITPTTVFINAQAFTLIGENRYLRKVEMMNKNQQDIIEFTIGWETRKGHTFDELRIPVASSNFTQAENILNYFNKTQ